MGQQKKTGRRPYIIAIAGRISIRKKTNINILLLFILIEEEKLFGKGNF
jgi:hypothetical protein